MHLPDTPRGQTLVEFALIAPLFVMVLTGIVVLGTGIFFQQQITNAAREAARYAAIHSATAQCPSVPRLPYDPQGANRPLTYTRCDRPENGWPFMRDAGRNATFAIPKPEIHVSACWSGYRASGGSGSFDAWVPGTYDLASPPIVVSETESVFVQCEIGGRDPLTESDDIPCRPGIPTTDHGSAVSEAPGRPVGNTVTVFTCYMWQPPLAGFLVIPQNIVLRAVVTEAIQRQQ